MNIEIEIGMIFIYISAFGLSDIIVKRFFKRDSICVIYYTLFGIVGLLFLLQNTVN